MRLGAHTQGGRGQGWARGRVLWVHPPSRPGPGRGHCQPLRREVQAWAGPQRVFCEWAVHVRGVTRGGRRAALSVSSTGDSQSSPLSSCTQSSQRRLEYAVAKRKERKKRNEKQEQGRLSPRVPLGDGRTATVPPEAPCGPLTSKGGGGSFGRRWIQCLPGSLASAPSRDRLSAPQSLVPEEFSGLHILCKGGLEDPASPRSRIAGFPESAGGPAPGLGWGQSGCRGGGAVFSHSYSRGGRRGAGRHSRPPHLLMGCSPPRPPPQASPVPARCT